MILRFNNYNISKLESGDFVKMKEDSPFFEGDKIYKIDRLDNISFYLINVFGDYEFFEITKHNVRKLTDDEYKEFKIILDTKKFNI